MVWEGDSGDERTMDCGLLRTGSGPGGVDAEVLWKGLLRHLGPLCAGALILKKSRGCRCYVVYGRRGEAVDERRITGETER